MFVGPWDLGNNIGRPVLGEFHADLSAAIERIRKAAVENGKKAGIYCVGGAPAKKYAAQGFHMVRTDSRDRNCSVIGACLLIFSSLLFSQISVVADAVALPTFLSGALSTAKGA